jgi:hypothetical protein
MSDLKTFLYISHVKVEMLYQQLPRKDATGAEYGVDVKVLKWVGKREPAKEAGKIEKLFAVVEHLKRSGKVGTYPNTLQYIEGTADMNWGLYLPPNVSYTAQWPKSRTNKEVRDLTRRTGFCLFAAETSRTAMGLVGSLKHVIGAEIPDISFGESSTLPDALEALSTLKGEPIDREMRPVMSFLRRSGRAETAFTSPLRRSPNIIPDELDVLLRNLDGCTQRLEFLARIYDLGETQCGDSVLIGSPLFVALAD